MRRRALIFGLILVFAAGFEISPAHAATTLYDDLGSQEGIAGFVGRAVDLFLADDRIKADFDNINLDRLRERIALQICQLAGGPCHYPGRPMGPSHKGLAIDQARFNALVEDLQTAMDRQGVPFRTQNRLLALLAPMERDIVTR